MDESQKVHEVFSCTTFIVITPKAHFRMELIRRLERKSAAKLNRAYLMIKDDDTLCYNFTKNT